MDRRPGKFLFPVSNVFIMLITKFQSISENIAESLKESKSEWEGCKEELMLAQLTRAGLKNHFKWNRLGFSSLYYLFQKTL